MNRVRAFWVGAVLTAAIVGTSALAMGAGYGGGEGCAGRTGKSHVSGPMMGSEERLMKMADRLELNDEQRATVKRILAANKTTFEDYEAQLNRGREAMRGELRSDSYDQVAVREMAQAQGAMLGEMMVLRADLMHQVRQVLTAEQIERMDALRGRHRHGAF